MLLQIDNLVKGASGQALQNLNLIMGFPENLGLQYLPLFPQGQMQSSCSTRMSQRCFFLTYFSTASILACKLITVVFSVCSIGIWLMRRMLLQNQCLGQSSNVVVTFLNNGCSSRNVQNHGFSLTRLLPYIMGFLDLRELTHQFDDFESSFVMTHFEP